MEIVENMHQIIDALAVQALYRRLNGEYVEFQLAELLQMTFGEVLMMITNRQIFIKTDG